MANTLMAHTLEGKTALVTGATRGIGQAIALALAECGCIVIGTATTAAGAASVTETLAPHGGRGVALDVTDVSACDALLDALSQDGAPHILVNNAGITRDALALRLKNEDWDAVITTNLSSVFRLARGCLRVMMRARWGRIVNITSVVAASGNAGQANYAAAKAGVAGMTRALAREVGSRGITVNCVAPGFIDTDMTRALTPEQIQTLQAQIPLARLGAPADVAHAVAYLVSPQAGYVTGTTLHVNGGMYMQ